MSQDITIFTDGVDLDIADVKIVKEKVVSLYGSEFLEGVNTTNNSYPITVGVSSFDGTNGSYDSYITSTELLVTTQDNDQEKIISVDISSVSEEASIKIAINGGIFTLDVFAVWLE
jgi:hypothetical protein